MADPVDHLSVARSLLMAVGSDHDDDLDVIAGIHAAAQAYATVAIAEQLQRIGDLLESVMGFDGPKIAVRAWTRSTE